MSSTRGLEFIGSCIDTVLQADSMTELSTSGEAADNNPYLKLESVDGDNAGYLRLWQADAGSLIDRMIHVQLLAGPVATQLFFVYGKPDSCMPHFHAQMVEFPPDGCVYNVDLLPRLDAITHPNYLSEVFQPLSKPYLKATTKAENTCSKALMNPAIAAYLSPWGIVSQRTNLDEFERVRPQVEAYLEHYLHLSQSLTYSADAEELVKRDAAHLDRFFDDDLDPRAWNGVYRIIGEAAGQKIKSILKTPLHPA